MVLLYTMTPHHADWANISEPKMRYLTATKHTQKNTPMTITLEFAPEEVATLSGCAQAQGMEVETVAW